jgi:DNA-binding transcriptional LysR family regulator
MLNETPLSRIDLNLLVLFEAVLTERHVGRAAERMKLSASAVSHGLRRLRDMLRDPLFLKHPKGVVPTERALALAEPIAHILGETRKIVAASTPFDPKTSRRRFTLGGPDAISAVGLPLLLARIRKNAPGIDIGFRHIQTNPWELIFDIIDAREVDVALAPLESVPPRFTSRVLFEEKFVIAMRRDHPLARTGLTLKRYCEAHHLVVSPLGDPSGNLDRLLAAKGLSRRVVLAVPSFMLALAAIAETDLLGAIPSRLAAIYGPRFGVVARPTPFEIKPDKIRAIAPKVALMDDGIAWLLDELAATSTKLFRPPA